MTYELILLIFGLYESMIKPLAFLKVVSIKQISFDLSIDRSFLLKAPLYHSCFHCDEWSSESIDSKLINKEIILWPSLNPLSANPTKWSNRLKQFVGKLPTNCLSVFDHFVGLALKGLKSIKMSIILPLPYGIKN